MQLSTLLPIPSLRVLLLAEGFAVDDSLAANLAPQLQDASPGRLNFLAVQGVARLSWRGLCGLLDSTGGSSRTQDPEPAFATCLVRGEMLRVSRSALFWLVCEARFAPPTHTHSLLSNLDLPWCALQV